MFDSPTKLGFSGDFQLKKLLINFVSTTIPREFLKRHRFDNDFNTQSKGGFDPLFGVLNNGGLRRFACYLKKT